jgi:hypothetical protein
VQSVIDRIPKVVNAAIIINVGAGTFAGVMIDSFIIPVSGSLTLQGTLGNPTLGGGTVSGTATAGDTFTCTDGGQAWVANALRGMLVKVGSEYRVIRNNDGTTLNLIGPLGATCNGKVYELFEQKTIFNTTPAGGLGRVNVYRSVSNSTQININDIKTSGGTAGIYLAFTSGGTISRCYSSGAASAGITLQSVYTEFNLYDVFSTGSSINGIIFTKCGNGRDIQRIYAYNNTAVGIYVYATQSVSGDYWYADYNQGVAGIYTVGSDMYLINTNYAAYNTNDGIGVYGGYYMDVGTCYSDHNGGHGIYFAATAFVDFDGGLLSTNTGWGMYVDQGASSTNAKAGSFINAYGAAITVSNNTAGGIRADNQSTLYMSAITGNGNGTFGLDMRTGSAAIITSATTVTGGTGDATINDGATLLTYGTHFATNGDKAINFDTMSRIERRD